MAQTATIPGNEQALAALPPTRRDLRAYLESEDFKTQVRMALPPEVAVDMFVRAAATAVMRTPDLIKCTQISFFRAALDLASYGLLPNGRDAHLIPFQNNKVCQCGHIKDRHHGGGKCHDCTCRAFQNTYDVQLIIDYKGLAKCVRRSNEVSIIHSDAVYEKDRFSFSFGSKQHLDHSWPEDGERGAKLRAFYSYVKLRDGSEDFIVMSKAEIDKVRERSKAKESGPWVSDYDEMGKKTVFRRHSKWLPFSETLRQIIERDDEFAGTVDIGAAFEAAAKQEAIDAPKEDIPNDGSKAAQEAVLEEKLKGTGYFEEPGESPTDTAPREPTGKKKGFELS